MGNASEHGSITFKGGIPLNVTLHAWPIPKFDPNLKQTDKTNSLIDKISESATNYSNSLHNLNATGYVAVDDDLTETGFSDVQTFILAGVATVIPLLVIVITILGVRFLWKKYRTKKEDGYEGVLQKEESSEPLGKLQRYTLPQKIKISESQFSISPGDDKISEHSTQLPTLKSNGSVITMTLKNNHLIVETEETSSPPEGIKVESKGTTTKFVTSKASEFGFKSHSSNTTDCSEDSSEQLLAEQDKIMASTNHGALIHYAPEETEGLSQSDLSVSSSESHNPSYRYGNQTGYDSGGYGYPEYCGYSTLSNKKILVSQTGPQNFKIYQRGYSITEKVDSHSNNRQAGDQPRLKNILMSDIQACEKREYDINHEEESIQTNGTLGAKAATTVKPNNNYNFENSISVLEDKEPFSKNETFSSDNSKYLSNNGLNLRENES